MRALILSAALAMSTATAVWAAPTDFGIGDVVYRKEIREALPNAFGKKDIFGRKRTAGFIEVRYRGLDGGAPVFTRRDTRVLTNENTMNRSGLVFGSVGNTNVLLSGTGKGPTMQALAPDETLIRMDLVADPVLLVDGVALRVLEATPSRVRIDTP